MVLFAFFVLAVASPQADTRLKHFLEQLDLSEATERFVELKRTLFGKILWNFPNKNSCLWASVVWAIASKYGAHYET